MCDQGLLVGLYGQDYKSMCTAVTTCAAVVSPVIGKVFELVLMEMVGDKLTSSLINEEFKL